MNGDDYESDPFWGGIYNTIVRGQPKPINECGDGDEICQGDAVYIDSLHVYKEYRGLGLGLFLIDAAVNVINSQMSLTLINPSPLQHFDFHDDSHPNDYHIKGSYAQDRNKLIKYYSKLGFKKIGNMLGVWNGYVLPDLITAEPKLRNLI